MSPLRRSPRLAAAAAAAAATAAAQPQKPTLPARPADKGVIASVDHAKQLLLMISHSSTKHERIQIATELFEFLLARPAMVGPPYWDFCDTVYRKAGEILNTLDPTLEDADKLLQACCKTRYWLRHAGICI